MDLLKCDVQRTATIAVAVLGIATAAARGEIEYDLTIVEAFNVEYDLRECYVRDINEAGRATGTSTFDSFYSGFVWDTGIDKTPIPVVWAEGINNLDQVVGDNVVFDIGSGVSTVIPGLNSTYASVYMHGLNDQGVAVGHAKGPGSDSDGVNRTPLVWDAVNGSQGISAPAARELLRVNNGNVAVGNIRWSAGDSEAFVYNIDTEEVVNLHELLSPTGLGTSSASDINEVGTVTGKGWNGTATQGFIWSGADGFTFMSGLAGGETMRVHPSGINGSNRVVGNALHGELNAWHAFIWDAESGMRDLNDLVEIGDGFILDHAAKINDLGWIVGYGHHGPGWNTSREFVLVPRGTVSVGNDVVDPDLQLSLVPSSQHPTRGPIAFRYVMSEAGQVEMTVHDLEGARVVTLGSGVRSAGTHEVSWDGGDQMGQSTPSGVYFVRVATPGRSMTLKVVRLR